MGRQKPLIEPALRDDSLSYHTQVTSVADATHFTADSLAGKQANFFQNWFVYVVRDAGGAGAAPQGELPKKITDSTNAGVFTHTAFVAPLAATDEILILHESVALAVYIEDMSFGDCVHVDDGGTDSTDWPYGIPTHPTSSLANGVIIAAARNLHSMHVQGLHTVNYSIAGYEILGTTGPIAFATITGAAGIDNDNCTFEKCIITGTLNGFAYYEMDCVLYDVTGLDGFIRKCDLGGTITFADPSLTFIDLNIVTTQQGPVTINCTNIGAADNVRFHDFDGTMTLTNLANATALIRIYSGVGSNIIIADTCTAGTIEIHGNCNVVNLGTAIVIQKTINAEVQQVFDIVNAMLVTTETGGTVSTDGANEVDVYINNAPAGVYKPLIVKIWFTNQTAAETVVIREKYRIEVGGGFIEADEVPFAGVQDPLLILVHLDPTRFGVQVTIEKTAGADRDYRWEVVYDI